MTKTDAATIITVILVTIHGHFFIHFENSAVKSHPVLGKQDGSTQLHADNHRSNQNYGTEHHQSKGCQQKILGALDIFLVETLLVLDGDCPFSQAKQLRTSPII